jgi:hypothetical protein
VIGFSGNPAQAIPGMIKAKAMTVNSVHLIKSFMFLPLVLKLDE